MSDKHHDPETCGCGTDSDWCPFNPDASELASSTGYLTPNLDKIIERAVFDLSGHTILRTPSGELEETLRRMCIEAIRAAEDNKKVSRTVESEHGRK